MKFPIYLLNTHTNTTVIEAFTHTHTYHTHRRKKIEAKRDERRTFASSSIYMSKADKTQPNLVYIRNFHLKFCLFVLGQLNIGINKTAKERKKREKKEIHRNSHKVFAYIQNDKQFINNGHLSVDL